MLWSYQHFPAKSFLNNHSIMQAGDAVLLCSDGLTNALSNHEIQRIVSNDTRAAATKLLASLARKTGSEDNISVIVTRVNALDLRRKSAPRTLR